MSLYLIDSPQVRLVERINRAQQRRARIVTATRVGVATAAAAACCSRSHCWKWLLRRQLRLR